MEIRIADLIEASFLLSHHSHIQPSEVDNLTSFEFRNYLSLLRETREKDMENRGDVMKALLLR